MNNIFGEINNVKKYFENKNWIYEINDNGVRFYKNGTGLNDSKQIVDFSTKKSQCSFYESFDSFKSITIDYFSQVLSDLQILNPINIYSGYGQNSFVSTGLEYYYDYLYNGMVISRNNTMVIQPSVRFKLNFFNSAYGNNDVMDFSSIAFNNLSIVHFENELDRIVNIENVLSFLSRIGIHASRVNFVLEYKIRQKNNNVSYTAVKFFVDNLEIGDILFLETNGIYLVEYGFGVERLFSRVLNKKYCDLFIVQYKFQHFIHRFFAKSQARHTVFLTDRQTGKHETVGIGFGAQLCPANLPTPNQPACQKPRHRHPKAAYYPANHTERQILHGERTEKEFLPTTGFRFP